MPTPYHRIIRADSRKYVVKLLTRYYYRISLLSSSSTNRAETDGNTIAYINGVNKLPKCIIITSAHVMQTEVIYRRVIILLLLLLLCKQRSPPMHVSDKTAPSRATCCSFPTKNIQKWILRHRPLYGVFVRCLFPTHDLNKPTHPT